MWFLIQGMQACLDAFAYRYRGGGWQEDGDIFALHSTFRSRVAWGIAAAMTMWTGSGSPFLAALTLVFAVLELIVIGHAPYQVMGRTAMNMGRGNFKHNWFIRGIINLFPDLAPVMAWSWDEEKQPIERIGALSRHYSPHGLRVCIAGMASVGFVRGCVTGLPLVLIPLVCQNLISWHVFNSVPWGMAFMPLFGAVAEPLAYAVGYRVPLHFEGLHAFSTEWAEFLRGLFNSVAVSLCLLLSVS